MLIDCPIATGARRHPDASALVWPEGGYSYRALNAAVAAAAGSLSAAGVGKGQRIALHHAPTPDLIVLLFALLRLGALAAPLSLRAAERQVPAMLETVGADALLADTDIVQTVARPLHLASAAPFSATTLNTDALATAVFTSGSTGVPKAIVHSVGNHLASARGANPALGLEAGDRWLLSLPLYHVGGLAILWRCFLAGATVCLPGGLTLAKSMSVFAITHLSVVPAQLRRLLADGTPPGGVRAVLCGGDATPPGLLDDARAAGWPASASYGCTEAASVVAMTPSVTADHAVRGSGTVLPARRLRIMQDGEIAVAGDVVAPLRLHAGQPAPLASVDGWYRTGDLGCLDADGTLHVTGRRDRQFISGGENLHPEAIEAALGDLPGILQAAVVAVPDAVYGHRPVAFVLAADGVEPSVAAIRAALGRQGRLPKIAWPDRVHAWPQEGGIPAMKPDRRALAVEAGRLAAAPVSNGICEQPNALLFQTPR